MTILSKWLVISLLCCLTSCDSSLEQQRVDVPAKAQQIKEQPVKTKHLAKTQQQKSAIIPVNHNDYKPIYPWKNNSTNQQYSVASIPSPKGYQRTALSTQSRFSYWLRHLPIQPEGARVYFYNGKQKPYQKGAHSVVDIDVGKRDLQQCADAVMRLKAEHHYSLKEYQSIHFNYTSGHKVSFEDWRKGKQPRVSGNSVNFSSPNGKTDNSYRNFKKYMNAVFSYAGTASLSKELKRVPITDMQIGDVFIQGGFPGHAVIVVDMSINSKTGEKVFLIAQSYMPAQSIHVLNNLKNIALSPWYPVRFDGDLHTPEWSFSQNNLKRFQ